MVTTATSPLGLRRALVRCAYGLALALAVIAAALLVLAPIGWRARWWPLRFSFFALMPWAGYLGIAALAVAVLALLLARAAAGRRGVTIAAAALVAGALIAYVPLHYNALRGKYPPIDDITTDTADPPAFVAAVALRRAEGDNPTTYQGAKIAAQQTRAYPDIAPLELAMPPAQAFSQALDTARHMGWTVLSENPGAGRIEATAKSRWFGFVDDIVIRITAAGSGSRVDMRSSSRLGRGDFGVNAARIRAYMAALRKAAGEAG